MLYTDKFLMRRRRYAHSIVFYDLLSKSDISLIKKESKRRLATLSTTSNLNLPNVSNSNLNIETSSLQIEPTDALHLADVSNADSVDAQRGDRTT